MPTELKLAHPLQFNVNQQHFDSFVLNLDFFFLFFFFTRLIVISSAFLAGFHRKSQFFLLNCGQKFVSFPPKYIKQSPPMTAQNKGFTKI